MGTRSDPARERGAVAEPAPGRARGALGLVRAVGRALLVLPRPAALVPACLWGGLIWYLSSLPPKTLQDRVTLGRGVSNFLHAPEFGLLALFLALAAPRAGGWARLDRASTRWIVVLTLAYALADELHQALTPGRDASVLDLVTDAAGVGCTLWIAAYAGRADAHAKGLWTRVWAGLALCAAAAALSTFGPTLAPDVVWL